MDLLLTGLNGVSSRRIVSLGEGSLRIMDKVYPIVNGGKVVGVLYIRYDLNATDETVDRARIIIIQSVLIALAVTLLLGTIISKNVTDPINDITKKASEMAKGDFNQYVDVRSDDEIGKLGGTFNHLTNQLKQSLNHLSQEKSKFEVIVNNIDDGIIALTDQRKIIHINHEAIRILSNHQIDIASHYDELAEQLPQNLSYDYIERTHFNMRGMEIVDLGSETYRVKFEPFSSEDGQRIGLIIVFQDITESHRLDNMRKDFVANVSHELKTPITSIKSYSETLMDGAVADQAMAHQFLEVINSEADRMNRIVRDLLQLSNFDAHRTQLNVKSYDWRELVKSVLQKMDVLIKEKHHKIVYDGPSRALVSPFDRDRIEQVIVNLLSNAIKYTPDGGKIVMTLRTLEDNVYFSVVDSGIGISKKHLPHLFERFYRVDKGRSREMGGTGLGLSIAKEIVELHGGEIGVTSKVGAGTTVFLTIPRQLAPDQAPDS